MIMTRPFDYLRISSSINLVIQLLVLFVLLDIANGAILGKQRHDVPSQRNVGIRNRSGRTIDIMWINTINKNLSDDEKYVSNTDGDGLQYGADTNILSYAGHKFEIRELPSKSTGECKFHKCRKVHFEVNSEEEQEIEVTNEFKLIYVDNHRKAKDQAKELVTKCHTTVLDEYNESKKNKQVDDATNNDEYLLLLEKLEECVQNQLNSTLEAKKEEQMFESSLRQRMAKDLPNYSCYDMNFTTSQETENRTFDFSPTKERKRGIRKERYEVNVLHERPDTSFIAMVPNFLTHQECRYLKQEQTKLIQEQEASSDSSTLQTASIPWSVLDGTKTEAFVLHHMTTKMYQLGKIILKWGDMEFDDMKKIVGHNLFDVFSYIDPKEDEEDGNDDEDNKDKTRMECTRRTSAASSDDSGDGEKTDSDEEEEREEVCYMVNDNNDVPTIKNVLPMTASTSKSTTESISITNPDILGQVFLFCDEPEKAETNQDMLVGNGGIQFPHAGIHINPRHGMLVFATYRSNTNSNDADDVFDGFTQDYHLCPPQNVFTHTFVRKEQ